MAQFLIKAHDAPVEDSPGKWRAGDVVAVFDDEHTFGLEEKPPVFWIVKVTGLALATAQDWLTEHPGVARRLDRFDATTLTNAQRNALNAGPVTITLTRLNQARKRIAAQ